MILVFGSINIDLSLPLPHLPQPGETVLGGDYALAPGGKGANQALAARRAGAAVAMAGAVGEDAFAEPALALLRRAGVDLGLVRSVGRPTGCAAILVAACGENLIAVAPGANEAATAGQVPDTALTSQTLLVTQLEVPAVETAALIRRARSRGASVVLNLAPAAPIDPGLFADIDVLVANAGEAAMLGGAPERLASRLRQGLVVTRGGAGASAFLAEGGRLETPALPIAAIDTTGAGDTFVGVLAAALDQGVPLAEAMRRGSAAAGLCCLARGAQTGTPDRAAIEAAIKRLPV